MQGLLSFLLFAGFFYFMMRFGCGAHMVHGHAGHQRGSGTTSATDPVCGMSVADNDGYTKVHDGRPYRFCSRTCLDKFEVNPGQYLTQAGGAR